MKLPRLAMLAALATAGVMVSSGSAYAAPHSHFFGHHASYVVGHAYANDNTATSNTVAGFDRHADGSLTPIPGSPFTAGGAGLGAGLASQGAIQLSSDGRYLLAVDAGSNQISVLRLGYNGVPKPVGTPVSSGGSEPVSIAVSGDLVYVANAGASETNVTGFRLSADGDLSPVPGSTVALPAGSGPDDVLFDPRGHKLVVNLVNTSTIASFHVRRDGLLVPAPGSPIAAQGPGPFGAEFRPTNPSQLFVSNAHGGEGNGT
ncbi:MAG TPA: beta-propeller fold lactonase family protein, partial [Solirubrobacteraceae bacterium]|nr:beta-propeller fold lactonase family protein [Solirubrobacteraceae bacterium]